MCPEKTAHRSGQCAERYKDQGESSDKACGADERFSGAPFPTASEVGEINGEHGQQAGGNKGDDSL